MVKCPACKNLHTQLIHIELNYTRLLFLALIQLLFEKLFQPSKKAEGLRFIILKKIFFDVNILYTTKPHNEKNEKNFCKYEINFHILIL